jgi:ADP-ribosyl-[dinitrogen reductase] hydrolase
MSSVTRVSRASSATRTPAVEQFAGALLGLAVGDALGRPVEGRRQHEIRQRSREELLTFRGYHDTKLGRALPPGAWSDDTQQALLLADSLIAHRGLDARDFSDRLHALWLSREGRGYGRVYQKAMARLDAGQPWDTVAVDDDTYNGAAMRILPLGLFYWFDPAALAAAAARSSRVTHSHPAACAGAAGVALAAAYALTHEQIDPHSFVEYLYPHVAALDTQMGEHVRLLERAAEWDPDDAYARFCDVPLYGPSHHPERGGGVSGNTVALLLTSGYLFLHSQGSFLRAVEDAMLLGGDTDGTGGTAGALCAAWSGPGAIPEYLAYGVDERERICIDAVLLHRRSLEAAGSA